MKFAGNPPGDPRLNRSKVIRLEFVPAGPEIFGGGRVGDPHVHTQKPRRAALRAPGDDVIEPAFGRASAIAQRGSFVFQRFSESARLCWRRSVTRSSVKASTKYCWSGSPVKFRKGATATEMLGSRQGHHNFSISSLDASGCCRARPSSG